MHRLFGCVTATLCCLVATAVPTIEASGASVSTSTVDGGPMRAGMSYESAPSFTWSLALQGTTPVNTQAHQFNMCNVAAQCAGGPSPVDLDLHEELYDPWLISLNEVCFQSVVEIVNRTPLRGWFVPGDTFVSACPGPDRQFGNAVIFVGMEPPGLPPTRCFTVQGDDNDDPCKYGPNDPPNSVAICVLPQIFDFIEMCSAHLEGSADEMDVAIAQANEYEGWARSLYPFNQRWLGGDLNLLPNDVPQRYRNGYDNGYPAPTYTAITRDRQIDYVWHDKPRTDILGERVAYCDNSYSDHCYVFAGIRSLIG